MALKKVQKSIVFGSVLVAHYGKDLTDLTTSSATYVQWGTDIVITMQFATSHLEIVTTGSGMVDTNQGSGSFYGNAKYMINGQDEYFLRGIVGGNMSLSGAHSHQNQQHGESNGRQNWRNYGSSSALYMNHIHAPSSTNAQVVKTEVACENAGPTFNFSEGYITISEIAGDHYNLT